MRRQRRTADGCRNTALHVAAARTPANARAAMVAFLIAERADVSKANKNGCAAQQRARRPPPTPCCAMPECAEAALGDRW